MLTTVRRRVSPLDLLATRQQAAPGFSYKYAESAFALDSLAALDAPEVDEDAWSIKIPFAASQGRDRVGDFLEVDGINTTNHRRLPVAFIDHGKNYSFPIGKCETPDGLYTVEIDSARGLATATIFLDRSQMSPIPEQVLELYKQGILKAGSIGYRPILAKPLPPDLAEGHKGGVHLIKVELLEVSPVGLPCNGDAVRRAMERKGLDPAIKSMLAPWADRPPAWSRGVKTFNEADHPRGQPDNPGQFGPGGGGGGGSDKPSGEKPASNAAEKPAEAAPEKPRVEGDPLSAENTPQRVERQRGLLSAAQAEAPGGAKAVEMAWSKAHNHFGSTPGADSNVVEAAAIAYADSSLDGWEATDAKLAAAGVSEKELKKLQTARERHSKTVTKKLDAYVEALHGLDDAQGAYDQLEAEGGPDEPDRQTPSYPDEPQFPDYDSDATTDADRERMDAEYAGWEAEVARLDEESDQTYEREYTAWEKESAKYDKALEKLDTAKDRAADKYENAFIAFNDSVVNFDTEMDSALSDAMSARSDELDADEQKETEYDEEASGRADQLNEDAADDPEGARRLMDRANRRLANAGNPYRVHLDEARGEYGYARAPGKGLAGYGRKVMDAEGHAHDEIGRFTGPGGGGDAQESLSEAKPASPEKKPAKHFADRIPEVANTHRQNMRALLGKMQKGEYDPADALEDADLYQARAEASIKNAYMAHLKDMEAKATVKYGEEALASPEWRGVRRAFKQAAEKANSLAEEMSDVVRANARYYADPKNADKPIKISADDLGALDKDTHDLHIWGYHGSANLIGNALDAFRAVHKPISPGGKHLEWYRPVAPLHTKSALPAMPAVDQSTGGALVGPPTSPKRRAIGRCSYQPKSLVSVARGRLALVKRKPVSIKDTKGGATHDHSSEERHGRRR